MVSVYETGNLVTLGQLKKLAQRVETELDDLNDDKQDAITATGVLQGDGQGGVTAKTVDVAPASGSSNLITSGAVYAAIMGAIGGSY